MKSVLIMAALVLLPAVHSGAAERSTSSEPLLQMAYDAVSAMPTDPHIKNRSREQYTLVQAALDLDQPELAEHFGRQITYWQQGATLADVALYDIEHDQQDKGRALLAKAQIWLDEHRETFAKNSSEQNWRFARVAAAMAMAYTALGEDDRVAGLKVLASSESHRILEYKLSNLPDGDFDQALEGLKTLADAGEYASISSALNGMAVLYGKFYDNSERRKAIVEAMDAHLTEIPYLQQVELTARLGEIAVAHKDMEQALKQAAKASGMLELHETAPRFFIPVAARIASLYASAGQPETARKRLEDSLAMFDAKRALTVNIDRAGMLCPIAEAYVKMGDTERAMAVYGRAIAEGQVNPNSRPRASDLSLICRSMAQHEVVPSGAIWKKLEAMKNGLGNPW